MGEVAPDLEATDSSDQDGGAFDNELGMRTEPLYEFLPADGLQAPWLGWGRNSITGEYQQACIDVTQSRPTPGSSRVEQLLDLTEKQAMQSLGVSASAKGAYGLYSASGRASFARSTQSNSLSLSYTYANQVHTDTLTAERYGNLIVPDASDFLTRCGDTYVQEVKRGAELYISFRMNFATEADKTAFSASFKGSYASNKVAVDVAKLSEAFKDRISIQVSAYQIGGDPEKLATAFSGKSVKRGIFGNEAETANSALLDCNIKDMRSCNVFMSEAIRYATTWDADAANNNLPAKNFPLQAKRNPTSLGFSVRGWDMLGIKSFSASAVPSEVASARKTLLDAYRLAEQVSDQVGTIQKNGYLGGDPAFRTRIDRYAAQAAINLEVVQAAVPKCFDALSYPPTRAQVTACVTAAALKDARYSPIKLSDLALELKPSSFQGRSDYIATVTPTVPKGREKDFRIFGENVGWTMCPAGKFVHGFAMTVESDQRGGDDTALDWVAMHCATWNRSGDGPITPARPSGKWGSFGTRYDVPASCDKGPMNGINVLVEPYLGSGGDDTGANDLIGSCVSGNTFSGIAGAPWGEAFDAASCPSGSAVCGFNMIVEPYQGTNKDDTGMNNISVACCKFPGQVKFTPPLGSISF